MRDPNRLYDFYGKLNTLHRENFSDWRFGQLCSNFFGWLASEKNVDLFYPEENKMLQYFEEYCEKYGNK